VEQGSSHLRIHVRYIAARLHRTPRLSRSSSIGTWYIPCTPAFVRKVCHCSPATTVPIYPKGRHDSNSNCSCPSRARAPLTSSTHVGTVYYHTIMYSPINYPIWRQSHCPRIYDLVPSPRSSLFLLCSHYLVPLFGSVSVNSIARQFVSTRQPQPSTTWSSASVRGVKPRGI
jgi:hypothetical protein